MTWADSVPNLLIGLREGLEAGLVVTILLAAVKKTAAAQADGDGQARASTAPIWLGVLGAVSLSGAFAAVLTFSVSVLSSAGQEAVGGLLSVFAVGLVTAMIFWMRRTAATLSSHLRGEVARAAAIGTGALTITAFLSVGREGLETTLFLWTAARASGQTAAPLVGAAIGIAAAVVLCWLLYRRAVHLNVGVFFNRTAIALIVIAAGVLAYGLGDLQDANFLPGHAWVAFDLTAHIDPTSWWASIITGITELAPKMTVLQVTAYLAYLAVVVPAFVNAGRAVRPAASPATASPLSAPAQASAAAPSAAAPSPAPILGRWERLAGGRPWAVAGVLVAVPALAAGLTIVALPAAAGNAADGVTVSATECAPEFTAAESGSQTFTVANNSGLAGEIRLDNAAGAVVGEIETLGPGTSAPLTADLGNGAYAFRCLMGSKAATASQTVQVTAKTAAGAATPVAVKPVTVAELTPPNKLYQAYAAAQLKDLAGQVAKIKTDLGRKDIGQAKTDWLAAQLDWERVGASYDSFGDLGLAVDGLPTGFVKGVNDPGFTGLHRLEYGLWHGQPAAELLPVTDVLAKNVAGVEKNLTSDDLAGDPTQLPLRVHEIIEDALRDHLSGIDDEGGNAAYAQTWADTQVDRVVLGEESALINDRDPGLVATAQSELTALDSALLATKTSGGQWQSLTAVSLGQRQHVDAATGALLETLAVVPDLLEVPPGH
ncbi:MAG TPA: iron uptake transporter permease EfeU [Trebonia sp.]|nr:iron uptake transporter permease EfeU [Trebonia sp.]